MSIVVIATLYPAADHLAETETLLRELVDRTRTEPGNLRYDLARSQDTPTTFTIFEVYRDEAALEAHRNSEHYLAYRARFAGLMRQAPDLLILDGIAIA